MAKLTVSITNEQTAVTVDEERLRAAALAIFKDAGVDAGALSLAIVDDPTIHDLNRRFLNHDEPTDALSFLLEREDSRLEGEVVVSGDTARRVAPEFGWSAEDELLLYVIHGALHLVGHDDIDPADRERMRAEESHYLLQFGAKRSHEE